MKGKWSEGATARLSRPYSCCMEKAVVVLSLSYSGGSHIDGLAEDPRGRRTL